MLKTLLTTALGLTAAATLTVEAEGCRFQRLDFVHQPVMSSLVHRASTIELARVVSAQALADGQAQFGETHAYQFETVAALYGEPSPEFTYRGAYPFQNNPAAYCVEGEPDCAMGSLFHGWWQAAHEEADAGRANWSEFRYRTSRSDGDGMGGARGQMGSEIIIITCGDYGQSFEVGETFLVFRDAMGAPLDGHGLNFQLITRDDDQWLTAVRYFLDHPDEDWLPAISAREAMGWLYLPRKDVCMEPIIDASAIDCWLPIDQLTVAFKDFRSTTNSLPEFPEFPLPIRDGMVDLSGIPSQFAIEPSQVPLTDVIAWLSEAPETESPQ